MDSRSLFRTKPNRPLIAAHRGVSSANIPCNTIAAYGIALMQHADIVEIDVARSTDGKLFVFHPGMEKPHLHSDTLIQDMHSSDVEKLVYLNQDDTPTQCHVNTLDEVLSFLKDKCYINVDKFWMYPEEIAQTIRKCGVEKQVIVKTPLGEEHFAAMEKYAPDLGYIPMVKKEDTVSDMLLARNINYLGAEVIFDSESDPVCSDAYIKAMHEKGLMVWGNAIVYDYKAVISAYHTDDGALTESMDKHWGWFIDKGFDIIQTDWCAMLREYILNR